MECAWTNLRLGDVCTKIGSGATPLGGSSVYLNSGRIALIRSQNVHNDGFRCDGLAFITQEHAEELQQVEVMLGDVLLNITGDSVARCCQVDGSILPARVNQHVAIIRPSPQELDARFLRFLLVSPQMQAQMLSWAASGGTRNALTKGMIESLEIAAPIHIGEQRAIAHILGTLHDKIELNRRMNETLEAMARAIFKSWFVDFDPVRTKAEGRQPFGMDAETAALFPDSFEDSPLGLIPKGWKAGKLAELIRIVSGGTPKTSVPEYWDGDIPWFSVADTPKQSDVFVIDTEKHITDAGLQNCAARLLNIGTTIVTARGTVGKLALVGVEMAMNQSCYGIQASNGHGGYFVFFALADLMHKLKQSTHGTVFETITRDTFSVIDAVIPPETVTAAFDRVVAANLARILGNLRESKTLASIRDALLPKLISGEIRVRDVHVTDELFA